MNQKLIMVFFDKGLFLEKYVIHYLPIVFVIILSVIISIYADKYDNI